MRKVFAFVMMLCIACVIGCGDTKKVDKKDTKTTTTTEKTSTTEKTPEKK